MVRFESNQSVGDCKYELVHVVDGFKENIVIGSYKYAKKELSL